MAAETINVMFRKEIGPALELSEVSDVLLEDTMLPRALAYVNALCRQTYTISDYTAATIGTTETDYLLVDQAITLVACYFTWQYLKRNSTIRSRMEFPEYQQYIWDAYELIQVIFPDVVEFKDSVGHYVPSPMAHSGPSPHFGVIVGDSAKEGGFRNVTTSQPVDEDDYV